MDCILAKLDRYENKHIIYGGDFNIDLSNLDHDTNCQQLIDTTTRYNFIQVINRPTRITDHSATLIDHIYANKVHDIVSPKTVPKR